MFTYSQWLVDFLAKAAGHKYIKRVPYVSGGKRRYRYIYKVTHAVGGKHVLDPEHMVVNAAFMLSSAKGSEIHAHITKVDGDVVTYRLDDGPRKGELVTESKSKLAERLNAEHGVHEALAGAREKQAKVVADLRAGGASEKHVAREQARLDRLNAATPAPEAKSEEPKKRAAKKPKRERSSDELDELHQKVHARSDVGSLSEISDEDLAALGKYERERSAYFKPIAAPYLALVRKLHQLETKRDASATDKQWDKLNAQVDQAVQDLHWLFEGSDEERASDAYDEHLAALGVVNAELRRRKAASAN